MSLIDLGESIPRRTMVMFFLIDTSGSMGGAKIGAINSAMEEIIPELRILASTNADAQVKIAVLKFSTDSEWITETPIDCEDFEWNELDTGGLTALGSAYKKLNEKLSKNSFMQEATGSFAPGIILMSDGGPTDTDEYPKALAILKENAWFKKSIKVALAIGDDANKDVLKEFTGTEEAVVTAHSAAALISMIKFLSVAINDVASKPSDVGSSDTIISKQDVFLDQLKSYEDEFTVEDEYNEF